MTSSLRSWPAWGAILVLGLSQPIVAQSPAQRATLEQLNRFFDPSHRPLGSLPPSAESSANGIPVGASSQRPSAQSGGPTSQLPAGQSSGRAGGTGTPANSRPYLAQPSSGRQTPGNQFPGQHPIQRDSIQWPGATEALPDEAGEVSSSAPSFLKRLGGYMAGDRSSPLIPSWPGEGLTRLGRLGASGERGTAEAELSAAMAEPLVRQLLQELAAGDRPDGNSEWTGPMSELAPEQQSMLNRALEPLLESPEEAQTWSRESEIASGAEGNGPTRASAESNSVSSHRSMTELEIGPLWRQLDQVMRDVPSLPPASADWPLDPRGTAGLGPSSDSTRDNRFPAGPRNGQSGAYDTAESGQPRDPSRDSERGRGNGNGQTESNRSWADWTRELFRPDRSEGSQPSETSRNGRSPTDSRRGDRSLEDIARRMDPRRAEEMARELTQAMRRRGESAGNGPPGSQVSIAFDQLQRPNSGQDAGMLDRAVESMMNSVIKRSQSTLEGFQRPENRSTWRKLTNRASELLRKLKGQSARANERYHERARQSMPNLPSLAGGGPSMNWDFSGLGGLVWLGFVGLLAGVVFVLWRQQQAGGQRLPPWWSLVAIPPIQDRRSLVAAVEGTAVRHFGWQSIYWTHQRLMQAWRQQPASESSQQLMGLYELARYAAPSRELTPQELESARLALSQVQPPVSASRSLGLSRNRWPFWGRADAT